jgi:hypothetical protein
MNGSETSLIYIPDSFWTKLFSCDFTILLQKLPSIMCIETTASCDASSLWYSEGQLMIPCHEPSKPVISCFTALFPFFRVFFVIFLEVQFQPVNDPPDPAVIEMVGEALQAYSYAPASEPKLTNPAEIQDAIRGLKASKAPGPNGIPNRALKHLPQRAVSLLGCGFQCRSCTRLHW